MALALASEASLLEAEAYLEALLLTFKLDALEIADKDEILRSFHESIITSCKVCRN